MPAKKLRINLLPQEEFEGTTFGRVLTWALSSFRIIVIVTEMIVMLAFLSRFWLDARLSDLNDSIKQKQSIISAQAGFEKDFRDLQKRLNIFTSITSLEPKATTVFDSISTYIPQGVILSSVSKTQNTVLIRGTADSERSIAQFIANLEAAGVFKNVELTSVDTDTELANSLVFDLGLSTSNDKEEQK